MISDWDGFLLERSLRLKEELGSAEQFYWKLLELSEQKIELERIVRSFICESLERFIQLLKDSASLVEDDRVIAASMCARGCVESGGILLEFLRKFEAAVRNGDIASVIRACRNFVFASKEFGEAHDISTPHVHNGVRTLDKHLLGAEKVYNTLCETVHPNWSGRVAGQRIGGELSNTVLTRNYVSIFFLSEVSALLRERIRLNAEFVVENRRVLKKVPPQSEW
jgi:hypothetical protein